LGDGEASAQSVHVTDDDGLSDAGDRFDPKLGLYEMSGCFDVASMLHGNSPSNWVVTGWCPVLTVVALTMAGPSGPAVVVTGGMPTSVT
jgi:hypothetical protein